MLSELVVVFHHRVLVSSTDWLDTGLFKDFSHLTHNFGCISEQLIWNYPPCLFLFGNFLIMVINNLLIRSYEAV